ncbi:MAG: cupin domain-containing protein [Limnothrix sp.]
MSQSKLTKSDILKLLHLEPHLEGGYFRETYRTTDTITTDRVGGDRAFLTSIYYLLTDDRPIDYLHRNQSPIMHYFHGGATITYHLINLEGQWQTVKLGLNLQAGEVPQLLVPAGYWKTAILETGEFGLLGEAVAPGFDYRDLEVAQASVLNAQYPQHQARIWEYIHPDER